ncbi:hypothetical protein AVEN_185504-1 [Araneus ventricosus]|uniref:Uncharacterized protein n=1 Tax=Araneus ventricosus TaxID=182803 RepID=A0A4Y2G8T1_ARAVE|nr:hypothetical protein AVEN_185504-1 [Araneus ventricosus]
MITEQVLMRSMKVSGDFTQGRNISGSVITRWICTMPGSVQVTEALEAFAEVTGEFSDQHIFFYQNRGRLEISDLKKFLVWVEQHSPYNKSEELISLS